MRNRVVDFGGLEIAPYFKKDIIWMGLYLYVK